MGKKQKTKSMSCGKAAPLIGCARNTLQRACKSGLVGRRIDIPGTDRYFFLISEKEIEMLKGQKTLGLPLFSTK